MLLGVVRSLSSAARRRRAHPTRGAAGTVGTPSAAGATSAGASEARGAAASSGAASFSGGDAATSLEPAPARTLLYSSPPPLLVLAAGRLAALKAVVCTGYGASVLQRAAAGGGSLRGGRASAAAHAAGGLPAPLPPSGGGGVASAALELGATAAQLGLGFLALGGVAAYAAFAVHDRVVLRLELERSRASDAAPAVAGASASAGAGVGASAAARPPLPPPPPHSPAAAAAAADALCGHDARDTLVLTRPGWLWGTRVSRHARGDARAGAEGSLVQSFRLRSPGAPPGAPLAPRWLFPVEPGWASDDIGYLRTLVYGPHFRAGEAAARPPDAALVAVEGFGPYRPAALADPHAPGFAWFPPDERRALPGTPYRVEHGTAWADFERPPEETIEAARRRELLRARGGGASAAAAAGAGAASTAVPTLPAGERPTRQG